MSGPEIPDVVGFTEKVIEQVSHAAHAASGPDVSHRDEVGALPGLKSSHLGLDGWFDGPNVSHTPTRRVQNLARVARGASVRATTIPHVEGVVWHWTDTPHGTGPAIARSTAKLPGDRSSHLLIDGDGSIEQLAPLTTGTWHAGGPSARRWAWDRVRGAWTIDTTGRSPWTANSVFAGIELVNVGEVRLVGGKWLGWPFGDPAKERVSGRSAEVAAADVVAWHGWGWGDRECHYHAFTEAQIKTATEICREIRTVLGLPATTLNHGHHECDPDRRDDPGRYWHEQVMPIVLAGSAL